MKAEFQKFMNTATPRTIPNGQDYANRAKRSRSSEPGQGDEQTNPVAVIKGFPFPMWRKRLIDISISEFTPPPTERSKKADSKEEEKPCTWSLGLATSMNMEPGQLVFQYSSLPKMGHQSMLIQT